MALHPDLVVDCGNTDETWIPRHGRLANRHKYPGYCLTGNGAISRTVNNAWQNVRRRAPPAEQANLASRFVGEAQAFATHPPLTSAFMLRAVLEGWKRATGFVAYRGGGIIRFAQRRAIADRHGLTQVSMENLLRWQPILFWFRRPLLQILFVVILSGGRESGCGTTHLIFKWPALWRLDAPPGINRLLGLRRLHAWWIPPSIASLKVTCRITPNCSALPIK